MNKKIYALCDYETLNKFHISLKRYLEIIKLHNNLIYIQYRDKINSIETKKKNLLYLKENTNIPIIINDNLNLLEYCDGIHLGQEDLNSLSLKYKLDNINIIKLLRKKYINKIIGISTHNELEILESNKLDIDYIGLGAYRNTSTKNVSNILGNNISYLAKISKYPVGVIGGVTLTDTIENIDYYVIGSGLLKD